ncbi:MAG: hypothetical protein ACYTFV_13110 [Planctomycetota bacterium]|jgi:hypothetical protein
MASSIQSSKGNVDVGAIVRSYYRYSTDFQDSLGADFSGFVMEHARLYAQGAYGSFDWRFSTGFVEGPFTPDAPLTPGEPIAGSGTVPLTSAPVDQQFEAELLDAYARWNLVPTFSVQFGHINPRDSFTGSVRPDRLLFPQRSFLGELFHEWDLGVQFEGTYGNEENPSLAWSVAVLNGDDGTEEDLDLRARIDFHTQGNGAGLVEGSYEPDGEIGGTLGLFWVDDEDISDPLGGTTGVGGTIWGADYHATYGSMGLVAEYADLDSNAANAAGLGNSSAKYWSLAFSSLLSQGPGGFEFAARYEDLDSTSADTRLTLGLNYYVPEYNAKWQFAWVDLSSDDPALDGDVFQLGLSAALSTVDR